MASSINDYKKITKELFSFISNPKFIKLADDFHNTKSNAKQKSIINEIKKISPREELKVDLVRWCIRVCFTYNGKRYCFYYCRPITTVSNPN